MKVYVLLAVLLLCVACKKDKSEILTEYEQEVFDFVNAYRSTKGLSALEANSVIQKECAAHSQDMADGAVPFGRDGSADRAARIKKEIRGSNFAENVAMSYTTANDVVKAWRNNDEFDRNMLGDFNLAGISVKYSTTGTYYYTMIFLKNN